MKVLSPAFYALKDARTPMLLSLASIGVNLAAAYLLVDAMHLRHAALALANSAVAVVTALALFRALRSRLDGIEGRYLLDRFLRVVAASCVMAAPLALFDLQVHRQFHPDRLVYLGELAVLVPLGTALFFGACRLFRVEESEAALETFSGPLQRVLRVLRAKLRN
jgi:putative peptidoglycan lipid II flippase